MKKLFLLLLLTASVLNAAELTIARNGKACAGILIPVNAKPVVKVAANELAHYLKKITGATFTVGSKSSFKTNFRLGFGDPAGLANNEFVIRTNANNIDIYGNDDKRSFSWQQFYLIVSRKGTLRGVYHFLETLGVRWPLPDLEHVPQKKFLVLKDINIRYKPFFSYNVIANWGWQYLSRYADAKDYVSSNEQFIKWLVRIGGGPNNREVGCHTEQYLGLFRDPSWTSVEGRLMQGKNGKRVKRYSCWTHPDILKMWQRAADGYFSGKSAVECGFKYHLGHKSLKWPWPFWFKNEFMIDPMDNDGVNDGRCYCKRCQDFRKKHPCPDDSILMWRVINKVAQDVYKKYPGKCITTLAYPPKRHLPGFKLSPNVRVKVCLGGPKMCMDPDAFKMEMRSIEDWHKATKHKVTLWVYHCLTFNQSQPHIVEYYPTLLQQYMKGIKDHSAGMYMETNSANSTRILITIYLFNRLMRNPDLDLEKELTDYFRTAYGPAHREAKLYWTNFETNFREFWKKTVPPRKKMGLVTPWGYKNKEMHMKLWRLGYTEEFLKQQGILLARMEKKTSGTKYAKQVARIRKYIHEDLVMERNNAINKEKRRAGLKMVFPLIKGKDPTKSDWEKAPLYKLGTLEKYAEKLRYGASFKVVASDARIFLRAEVTDPLIKQKISRDQSRKLWKRNAFEVFFYAEKGDIRWQFIYCDWGLRGCSRRVGRKTQWRIMPGSKYKIRQEKGKWFVEASYPRKEILPNGGDLRFNVTRERRSVKGKVEFSGWSPLTGTRGWHDRDNYPTVTFR